MSFLPTVLLSLVLSQNASAPAPTGEIRGRITDKETGLPIARATIHLSMVDANTPGLWARTDDDGRYQFTGLLPGRYSGFIEGVEFRGTYLSAPLALPSPGFVLKAGEVRSDGNVSLQRARSISVRVVDEDGEPLTAVRISVKAADNSREIHSNWPRVTDDRGRLRVFGIPPGAYTICAEPAFPPTSRSLRRDRFLRTCYPSNAEAQAEPVRIERSDIEGLEIRLRRGRTFTISGVVLDSAGSPTTDAMVFFSTFVRNGSSSRGLRRENDGRFIVSGVEPGEYAIQASLGGRDRPEQRRDAEAAFVPIHVDSSDISDLVVTMAKAVEVAGRIILEDPAADLPRRPGYGPLLVHARLAGDYLPGSGSMRSTSVSDDRTFYLDGMFGQRTFEVLNVPPGWYVKAIQYGGKNIIDTPTELKSSREPAALQIVLSNRGAVVSGRVVDDRGAAAAGARVILFPADPARWGRTEIANVRVVPTGSFKAGPQREGDYLVIALPASATVQFNDREQLARLAEAAERLRLGDNEERTVDLRVAGIK